MGAFDDDQIVPRNAFDDLPPALSPGERLEDVGKGALTGLGEGAVNVVGAPGDITTLGRSLTGADIRDEKARRELLKRPGVVPNPMMGGQGLPTSPEVQKWVEQYTGPFYQPQTTEGQFARTLASHAPNLAFGPGGLGRRFLFNAAVPAAAGELFAQSVGDDPTAQMWARGVGELASPWMVSRAISPFNTAAARTQAAKTLRDEGVAVTAGQTTGSRALRYAEEVGSGAFSERQGEQFTRAALRRAGEDAPRATQDVLAGAFNRLGGNFDSLSAKYNLAPSNNLFQKMTNARDAYLNVTPEKDVVPAVGNAIHNVVDKLAQNNWRLTGEQYSELRSSIGEDARALGRGRDPDYHGQKALYAIQHALDDEMENTIKAGRSPEDFQKWANTRRQYRNLLVVERAASKQGEKAGEGLISPSALAEATKSLQGEHNFAIGRGDFARLAKSGQAVMSPLASSGTTERAIARALPMAGVGAVLGGGGAYEADRPWYEQGAGALLGGIGASMGLGAGLRSRPMSRLLGNTVLQGQRDTTRAAFMRALLAAEEAKRQRQEQP